MEQTLGKRIVASRKRLGMTQDQLAEQLGVTAQAVSKWENDQSCPDIATLPRLAEIFGITTDELLGMERNAPKEAEIVTAETAPTEPEPEGGTWEFKLDNSRRGHIGMALLVLLVGGLLLAGYFLGWDVSFWGVLWPSALLVFGLFGVLPKPSFFRIGCLFFGVYFLLEELALLPDTLGKGVIFPLILVVFGLSLLVDALRKPKGGRFRVFHNGSIVTESHKAHCTTEGEGFDCELAFGEDYCPVRLPVLSRGAAEVSFGQLTVDLSGCGQIADGCQIQLDCSFGELVLQVPRQYRVEPVIDTAFGSVDVKGSPEANAGTVINAACDASFGEIQIRYI